MHCGTPLNTSPDQLDAEQNWNIDRATSAVGGDLPARLFHWPGSTILVALVALVILRPSLHASVVLQSSDALLVHRYPHYCLRHCCQKRRRPARRAQGRKACAAKRCTSSAERRYDQRHHVVELQFVKAVLTGPSTCPLQSDQEVRPVNVGCLRRHVCDTIISQPVGHNDS